MVYTHRPRQAAVAQPSVVQLKGNDTMSIKTFVLAGVTSLALCAGAQAQQVANVAGQTNVAAVGQTAVQSITQQGSGNLGVNLQRVDQDVTNVNLGAAVNLRGGNVGGGQSASVGPQTNIALVDQKAAQVTDQRGTGGSAATSRVVPFFGGNVAINAQSVNQDVTNANIGIAANASNVRVLGVR